MITVVLNTFRRMDYLETQLRAIKGQTCPAKAIFAWRNDCEDDAKFVASAPRVDLWAKASENLGVFPRFALALMAQTEYVAIFDDDCIPGSRWFESCVAAIEREDGLYGVNGARFRSPTRYHSFELFGVQKPGYRHVEVDIVGHCWFLRRSHLPPMFDFPPKFPTAGEDMALSFGVQRLGLKTFAVRHPPGQREFWGSTQTELNRDGRGINRRRDLRPQFDQELQRFRAAGWKLLCESVKSPAAPSGNSLSVKTPRAHENEVVASISSAAR